MNDAVKEYVKKMWEHRKIDLGAHAVSKLMRIDKDHESIDDMIKIVSDPDTRETVIGAIMRCFAEWRDVRTIECVSNYIKTRKSLSCAVDSKLEMALYTLFNIDDNASIEISVFMIDEYQSTDTREMIMSKMESIVEKIPSLDLEVFHRFFSSESQVFLTEINKRVMAGDFSFSQDILFSESASQSANQILGM